MPWVCAIVVHLVDSRARKVVVDIVDLLIPIPMLLILIYPSYGCPVDEIVVLLQIPSVQIQMTVWKQYEAAAILHW